MPTWLRRCSISPGWSCYEFGRSIVNRRAGCDLHPAVIVESVRSKPDRTLLLSWKIADLARSEAIAHAHLAKALQYQPGLELL
ncbi:MAG: hypothetical protein K0B06_10560 [Brevefilum sp.]|nr:hypothetical protein [Brevefilum sp.]